LEKTLRSQDSCGLPLRQATHWRGLFSALKSTSAALALGAALSTGQAAAKEATFLVQLNDYDGDEAYFSLYLTDPSNRFVRTLWVSGDEERWYPDQPRWWKYVGRAQENLLAVTGASTAPGDRTVIRIELEPEILDAGYSVRVDTSVEDQQNHPTDVEVELTSDVHGDKIPGTGYVRYLRYKWD
jgi:hypothetical protein